MPLVFYVLFHVFYIFLYFIVEWWILILPGDFRGRFLWGWARDESFFVEPLGC